MDRIPCSACLFWEPLDKKTREGKPLGECRRYPTPPAAERPGDFWCGEGINAGVSPMHGRNRA
jgi:hypothetical protein